MDGDEIGALKQFVFAGICHAGFMAFFGGQVRTPGDDLHAEGFGYIGGAGAPITPADNGQLPDRKQVAFLQGSGSLSQALANEPDLPWGEGRFTPQFARAMGVLPALYPPRAARRKR